MVSSLHYRYLLYVSLVFSVEPVSDDYDDLSDLKPSEMDQVKEWELQFR